MDIQKLHKIDAKGNKVIWEIYVEENKIVTTSYHYGSERKKIYTKEVIGKNVGKKNSTTDQEQAIKEAKSKIDYKIRYDGYTVQLTDFQDTTVAQTLYNGFKSELNTTIKCMLLKTITYKESWIQDGCFQQPKIDGLRCIAFFDSQNWILTSRNNKPYSYLRHIKSDLDLLDSTLIYDGELTHPDGFQTLCKLATVQRKTAPQKELEEHITFNIFDLILDHTQSQRFLKLSEYIPINTLAKSIRFVEAVEVNTVEAIKKIHELYISKGYEGSVVRAKGGRYENKRSSLCVKVKDFDSTEFKVVGFRDGIGTDKGLVIWRCATSEGLEFDCVPKTSDKDRTILFKKGADYVGLALTVHHQGCTDDNIPRFPRGICFRETVE